MDRFKINKTHPLALLTQTGGRILTYGEGVFV